MNKERILIVDDETSARTGLASLISSWNYKTESAEDGEKAMALVPEFDPAVVVTDLIMPGMDGMALLRKSGRVLRLGRDHVDRSGER